MAVSYIAQGIFWYVLALLLALHEIETEGENGWAENLPTWKIKDITKFDFFSTRPLTGYHLTLGGLIAMIFHLPFFFGLEWSIAAELLTLGKMLLFTVFWDYLWFLFNPEFGPSNFKRENIPWHDEKWEFGYFPVSYLYLILVSVGLAGLGEIISPGNLIIVEYLLIVSVFLMMTAASMSVAKKYREIR